MSADNPLMTLLDAVSAHDDHSADLRGDRALIYLPNHAAVRKYAHLVTDPDADGNAMCGDLPVRFVVRPRVPAQRGASS